MHCAAGVVWSNMKGMSRQVTDQVRRKGHGIMAYSPAGSAGQSRLVPRRR